MVNIHSQYDSMHSNEMFYALICIDNHIIISISCMLSVNDDDFMDTNLNT